MKPKLDPASGNIFRADIFPPHMFSVPELNLAQHCLVKAIPQPWFCLAERSKVSLNGLSEVVERETLLMRVGSFKKFIDELDTIGSIGRNLGEPTAWSSTVKGKPGYYYVPFYSYEIPFSSFRAEPLVFIRSLNGDLVVNPDLWLQLKLTEKLEPEHVWYDTEKHIQVIRISKNADSESISINTEYLQKYLQARQLELLITEYRQSLFRTSTDAISADFVQGQLAFINDLKTAKVLLESWGPKNDWSTPYFVRRMQLWSVIKPAKIDKKDPFREVPKFDLATFVFPTHSGLVAPARFKGVEATKHKFVGNSCDFMDRVYFRQEVLVKYQDLPGYEISDDGAVRHSYYWSFDRSVIRFGDDYLSIAIGDFAEGVDVDEWPHWGQYVVEPPDDSYFAGIKKHRDIISLVKNLISELYGLNEAFEYLRQKLLPELPPKPLWKGGENLQAIKELKWFFPAQANDAEFRKRLTLLSTLIVDSLDKAYMRDFLEKCDTILPEEKQFGSIKLLQRVGLTAKLVSTFRSTTELKKLVKLATTKMHSVDEAELSLEVKGAGQEIYEALTALSALYELRVAVGLAHPPNEGKAAAALQLLNLPNSGWGRASYLALLDKLIESVSRTAEFLQAGAQ